MLVPSVMDANGSGTQRRYSEADVQLLLIAKQMLDAGLRLVAVRSMVAHMRDVDPGDLRERWLVIVGGECRVVTDPCVTIRSVEAGSVVHVVRPAPFANLGDS